MAKGIVLGEKGLFLFLGGYQFRLAVFAFHCLGVDNLFAERTGGGCFSQAHAGESISRPEHRQAKNGARLFLAGIIR